MHRHCYGNMSSFEKKVLYLVIFVNIMPKKIPFNKPDVRWLLHIASGQFGHF